MIYANQLIRSRVDSKNILNILNKKKLASIENKIAPLKDILKMCGLFELNNNENIYNSSKQSNVRTIIPVTGVQIKALKKKLQVNQHVWLNCIIKKD